MDIRTINDRRKIKEAFITPSSTGNTAILAAVANQRFKITSMFVVATLANSVKLQSATTDISALIPLADNGGFVLPFNPEGWFTTLNDNEALNFNMSVATSTAVNITYKVI